MKTRCVSNWQADASFGIVTVGSSTFRWNLAEPGRLLQEDYVCDSWKSPPDVTNVDNDNVYLTYQKIKMRPLTLLGNDLEDMEALTPNHFLLAKPAVAETLMPYSVSYMACRKINKMA